jgi:deoxycytidylate deaminase
VRELAIVAAESTCQKRVVVCELYDEAGALIARESNRCRPTGGVCCRLGVVQTQANYTGNECNSMHAEIRAILQLTADDRPVRAVVIGHDFPCGECEAALLRFGVTIIEVVREAPGCGPRR